jgi:hypothetical protein
MASFKAACNAPRIRTNVAGASGRGCIELARASATNIAGTRATVNDRNGTLPKFGFK